MTSYNITVATTVTTQAQVPRQILKALPGSQFNIVQHATNFYNSASSGAFNLVVTLPNNTTSGNCLIACVTHYYTPPVITIGGSADNWTTAVLCATSPALSGIFFDPNCLGGYNTVTFSFGSTGLEACYVTVYEVSGLSSSPLDRTAYSYGASGTTWSSGTTPVTSQPSEICFGVGFGYAPSGGVFTGPSNWVNTPSQVWYNVIYSAISGYLITSSTGTQVYSGTFAVSGTFYNAIATFKGALPNGTGVGLTVAGTIARAVQKSITGVIVTTGAFIKEIFVNIPSQPINVVQSAIGNNNNTGGYSLTVTLPNNTTAGNCLVACIAHYYTPPTSITLGGSADNWTNAVLCKPSTTLSSIYIDPGCLGGQNTVTFNFGTSGAVAAMVVVYEVSGLAANPIDQTDYSYGNAGMSWSSGTTGVTSQPSEICFGVAYSYYATTLTGPSNWVNTPSNVVYPGNAMAGYLPVTTEGAQTYSGTSSATSNFYNSIVTLKGALPNGTGLGLVAGASLQNTPWKLLLAILNVTSVVTRVPGKFLTSTVVAASTELKRITRTFASAVNTVSMITKRGNRTLSGVVAISESLTRKILPNLITMVILVSVTTRSVSRAIQGTFVVAGQTLRIAGRVVSTVIVATVTITRQSQRVLSAAAAVVTSTACRVGKFLIGTAAATASSFRQVTFHLVAQAVASAATIVGRVRHVILIAPVSVTTSVVAQYGAAVKDLIVKVGLTTTQWFTSSIMRRWKSPSD